MMSASRIAIRACRNSSMGVRSGTQRWVPAYTQSLHSSTTLWEASNVDLMTRIKDQLKSSMRSKDSFASTVYRSLLSEHQYAVKAQEASETSSSDGNALLTSILQKAVAKRQDSARQFRAASPSREDLADKEDREVELIKPFLPEQISVQELDGVVQRAIDEVKDAGIEGKKMLGEVMKRVSKQVDKSRAPGAVVSEAVKRLLSK